MELGSRGASVVVNYAKSASAAEKVVADIESFGSKAIAPGGVKTDMYTENSWHYVPGGHPGMAIETIDKGLANFSPLKRVGLPADIARVVAFLAGPDSEWINGRLGLELALNRSTIRINC